MNELDNYDLSDLNRAVNKYYKEITAGKTPVNNPKAYILGGQAGAGKTHLHRMIVRNEPNTVVINGDAYRELHPNYDAIFEKYGADAADHTQSFSNAVTNALIEKLSADSYNLIVEGTCRRAEVPLKTCKDFKEKGYEVELMIICCEKETAWQSTLDRYDMMIQQGKVPRAVSRDKFDEMVSVLADNVDSLYRSGEFDEIALYDRQENELYRMTDTPDISPYWIVDERLNTKELDEDKKLDLPEHNEHRGR
ncbi:MAG: zeta toxin family protein [Ruminococcus sp.]|nr:zeta toxin family protein [Ruminococcus sp.]